jgi:hypothetical protein
MHHVFTLFGINRWDHDFMEDHVFFELKLSDFSLPTDKIGKVVVVDEEVKNSLCFGEMN